VLSSTNIRNQSKTLWNMKPEDSEKKSIDWLLVISGVAIMLGVSVCVLFPRLFGSSATDLALAGHCRNQLRNIGLVLLEYHQDYGKFPDSCNYGNDGEPLLSWRVHVLPYLGHQELYDQFKLDEPWDSEHNQKLISRMPEFYEHPKLNKGEFKTNYLLPVGEGTLFADGEGRHRDDILDDPAITMLAVEANQDQAVIWTRPEDFRYDPDDPWRGLGKIHYAKGKRSRKPIWGEGCHMLMADGRSHFVSKEYVDIHELRILFSFNGKENLTSCVELFNNRLKREAHEIRETGSVKETVKEDDGC